MILSLIFYVLNKFSNVKVIFCSFKKNVMVLKNVLLLILFIPVGCFSQFGPQQIIDVVNGNPRGVYSVDIDGDGFSDVLSAVSGENKLVWYQNMDGLGNFGSQNIITSNLEYSTTVFSEDIDGDGDMDVISASILDDKIAWYKNLTILGIKENYTESFSVYPNLVKNVLNIVPKSDLKIESINLFDAL